MPLLRNNMPLLHNNMPLLTNKDGLLTMQKKRVVFMKMGLPKYGGLVFFSYFCSIDGKT